MHPGILSAVIENGKKKKKKLLKMEVIDIDANMHPEILSAGFENGGH